MKIIIALVGKAGSGKDTIAQALQRQTGWNNIVSCTTRPMREGEKHGVNYYYLTPDEFAEKIINGDMLEATYFNDWHYGTMKSSLVDGTNIGVFNPEGYDCLREMPPSDVLVLGFYIDCMPKTRMLRQLNREKDPDVDEIVRRWEADAADFEEVEANLLAADLDLCWNETEADLWDTVNYIKDRTQHIVDLLDNVNSETTTDSQE